MLWASKAYFQIPLTQSIFLSWCIYSCLQLRLIQRHLCKVKANFPFKMRPFWGGKFLDFSALISKVMKLILFGQLTVWFVWFCSRLQASHIVIMTFNEPLRTKKYFLVVREDELEDYSGTGFRSIWPFHFMQKFLFDLLIFFSILVHCLTLCAFCVSRSSRFRVDFFGQGSFN